MIFKKKKYICLVCGYDQLFAPLYGDKGQPDVSLICSCCAFQPGYDDEELGYTIESYRTEWIEGGAIRFCEKKKPVGWKLAKQLTNIGVFL